MRPGSLGMHVTLVAILALAAASFAWPQSPPPLALVQTIVLPDVRGRIDHLAIDVAGERLFVAALGNDTVEVVDLRAGRRSESITGLHEPQGVAYLAQGKRLVVANAGGGVDVFAGSPLTRLRRVADFDDADNVRVSADAANVFVGYGHALARIDASSLDVRETIALAGHPESFQLEAGGVRAYVNVPTAREIAVVDVGTGTVADRWRLPDVEANFPMAQDEATHRLFVGSRRPAALLVYDTATGARKARVPVGGDADDVFYDAKRHRIYVVCGEGVVDVVDIRDADRLERRARLTTARGARTGLFVPARDALYVAVPARGASSAEIRVYAAN
jgi:DNA-binding beta-propeller fold protein YncE